MRKAIGGSPTSSVKRRASVARERGVASARVAIVHGCSGSLCRRRYVSARAKHAVPDDVASLLTYLFREVLDGRNAHVTDGVQQALGRPPCDFRDYARSAAAAGAWS